MGRRPLPGRPKTLNRSPYVALAKVSLSYSSPQGTYLRVTHPFAAPSEEGARLACVKPAASVRSEPGSNSPVQSTLYCCSAINDLRNRRVAYLILLPDFQRPTCLIGMPLLRNMSVSRGPRLLSGWPLPAKSESKTF